MKTIVKSLNLAAITAMALVGVSNAQAQTSCSPAPSNIVNWWPGDGNANDIIGADNGTLVGGVTFAPGKVGQPSASMGQLVTWKCRMHPASTFQAH
jgi:hypothetical protein